MTYSCLNCKNYNNCKEICKKIKKYLQRKNYKRKYKKKGYSLRTIRRQEIPFSNDFIEKIYHFQLTYTAFHKRYMS